MNIVGFKDISPEFKKIAETCVGIVNANHFEQHALWCNHSPESTTATYKVKTWHQMLSGGMFQVGTINYRPVTVEFSFAQINGKWVMFYNACSVLVDHDMVDVWRNTDMAHAKHSDAQNFHIVLHHIGTN